MHFCINNVHNNPTKSEDNLLETTNIIMVALENLEEVLSGKKECQYKMLGKYL